MQNMNLHVETRDVESISNMGGRHDASRALFLKKIGEFSKKNGNFFCDCKILRGRHAPEIYGGNSIKFGTGNRMKAIMEAVKEIAANKDATETKSYHSH